MTNYIRLNLITKKDGMKEIQMYYQDKKIFTFLFSKNDKKLMSILFFYDNKEREHYILGDNSSNSKANRLIDNLSFIIGKLTQKLGSKNYINITPSVVSDWDKLKYFLNLTENNFIKDTKNNDLMNDIDNWLEDNEDKTIYLLSISNSIYLKSVTKNTIVESIALANKEEDEYLEFEDNFSMTKKELISLIDLSDNKKLFYRECINYIKDTKNNKKTYQFVLSNI